MNYLLTMFLAGEKGEKVSQEIWTFFNQYIIPVLIAIITITFIVCGVIVLFKYLTASDERAQAEAKKYTKMFLIGIVVALFILVLAAIIPSIVEDRIKEVEETNKNTAFLLPYFGSYII